MEIIRWEFIVKLQYLLKVKLVWAFMWRVHFLVYIYASLLATDAIVRGDKKENQPVCPCARGVFSVMKKGAFN